MAVRVTEHFLFVLTLVWEILLDFYALIMNVVFFFNLYNNV